MAKAKERTLMDRTRDAVGYCNSAGADEGTDLAAFMAIFHPNFDQNKTRELVFEARENGRRKRR